MKSECQNTRGSYERYHMLRVPEIRLKDWLNRVCVVQIEAVHADGESYGELRAIASGYQQHRNSAPTLTSFEMRLFLHSLSIYI